MAQTTGVLVSVGVVEGWKVEGGEMFDLIKTYPLSLWAGRDLWWAVFRWC